MTGELVLYLSESQGQWIPAQVLRYHAALGLYDLDCKPGVPPDRIREQQAEVAGQFQIGEEVEYFCGAQQWVRARVERFSPVQQTYDLSCRIGVPAARIRRAVQQTAFQPGEQVEYFSESAQRWIVAAVKRYDPYRGVYDLDVKDGAPAANVRRPVMGQCAFAPGDRVEYYSPSHQMWVPAQVLRYEPGECTYDLDVKTGALAERVRRPGCAPSSMMLAPVVSQNSAARPRVEDEEVRKVDAVLGEIREGMRKETNRATAASMREGSSLFAPLRQSSPR